MVSFQWVKILVVMLERLRAKPGPMWSTGFFKLSSDQLHTDHGMYMLLISKQNKAKLKTSCFTLLLYKQYHYQNLLLLIYYLMCSTHGIWIESHIFEKKCIQASSPFRVLWHKIRFQCVSLMKPMTEVKSFTVFYLPMGNLVLVYDPWKLYVNLLTLKIRTFQQVLKTSVIGR